jgi:hypothetical protein
MIDPMTGAQCTMAGIQTSDLTIPTSLTVLGNHAYVCDFSGDLLEVSIDTGAVTVAPSSCTAVTTWSGGLLVKNQFIAESLELYSTFEDVMNGTPAQIIMTQDSNTRMTAQDDTLFTSWHAGSQIDRLSLPSGDPLMPILLQGFDDWVHGMWVTSDGRLIIISSDSIFTFDIASGQITNVAPKGGVLLFGLFCWTNP